jgi:glycosyltransferase involved in cell wall biosynthesis
MATLGLCMIVKDEERFLEDCLRHVDGILDEKIVVIDSRTSDRSKDIAESCGAKCFDFDWKDDLSAIRNFGLEKMKSNWVLVLDADERLSEAGMNTILELINRPEYAMADMVGFRLEQRTYSPKTGVSAAVTTDPDALRKDFSDFQPHKLVRLFKNHKKARFKNKVHELIENAIRDNSGEIVDTDIVIHHFGLLRGQKSLAEKEGKYTDLLWQQLTKDPKNPRYNRQVAVAFMEKGMRELALKYFYRALKTDPKHPGLLADIGRCHVEMNNIRDAMKFFNMAIATDKKDAASMNNLAFIYMNMRKFDTAKALLDKASSVDPKNKMIIENRKILEQKMKK